MYVKIVLLLSVNAEPQHLNHSFASTFLLNISFTKYYSERKHLKEQFLYMILCLKLPLVFYVHQVKAHKV